VIEELLAENALFRLRAAQGVLGLADKHGPGRLEAACAKATAAGDPSYRTVKGILAAGTETTATPRPTGDGGAPAHLHGPERLFADTLTLVPNSDTPNSDVVGDVVGVVADVIPLPTAHRVLAAPHPSMTAGDDAVVTDIALSSGKDAS
jgi:hypothetical protein